MMQDFESYIRIDRQYSEVTVKNYLFFVAAFEHFLKADLYKPKELKEATKEDVQGFIASLKKRGLCKSSVSLYIVVLRCYYKWASYFYQSEELSKVSFFLTNIVKVTREKPIAIVPSKEEVFKLRNTLRQFLQLNSYDKNTRAYRDTLRAYATIEVLITAGLRSRELRGLKRQDVDLEGKTLYIWKGKGGHQRISLFGDSAVEVLKEYFAIYHFRPEEIIFPMNQANVINRIIKLWALRSRINPELHAHSFRHFFITESNKKGVPLEVIADQVGHTDLNSTRYYTHLDIDFIRRKYNHINI